MLRTLLQASVLGIALVAVAAPLGEGGTCQAADLFYNFYAPPGYANQSAELYISPRPTPPYVGHTYITYQPLMPHEFLYRHQRTYQTYHEDAGVTTTRVKWGHIHNHKPLQRFTSYPGGILP